MGTGGGGTGNPGGGTQSAAGGGAQSSGGGSAQSSGGGSASTGGGLEGTGGGTSSTGGGAVSSGGGSANAGGGAASTGGGSGSTGGGTTQGTGGGSMSGTGGGAVDAGVPLTASACFAHEYMNPTSAVGPNYDQFNPTIGSHCRGTNMQNITGVQRVVFLGDSITVGTPPTDLAPGTVYRAILANKLATLFNLTPPGLGWGGADYVNGVALPAESGDFVSCAKWGARDDDLMKDHTQVTDCIPASKRNLHHLVIMTMGGNDIDALTKNGGGTMPAETMAQLQADAQGMVDNLRAAVAWMKDPANVPGGVDVVFANNYEFTDGTGIVSSCPGASVAGIQPWQDVAAQTALVVWIEEQYMKVAVDTHSDMIFMLESFCGHGYERNNPMALCYRGPNEPLWFDPTCIHPNTDGHAALADLFYKTIAE
jgi:lysophospholipase L1-like esterase